ncbi:hypothetical protein [Nostoc sp. FACHB-888]|uniref:hypothetical protein n=1 Tax=Nostoc sp. FACHB-888 TaxID=2692842 RepID=UPI0016834183|nr:hypothetical protein [Nostoc sp. FACHB-888]MBD2249240.1 hypothetical protein [Nostoc sp. FACHB-888]
MAASGGAGRGKSAASQNCQRCGAAHHGKDERFLESLGKLRRSYLTDLEDKVLSLLALETGG